jgi:platelet-activating factor acetylhydrolase
VDTKGELLPVIIYSHGLGGHADIYSYQTHTLAAQGYVVLTLTHADGSSPFLVYPDGTKREYDYEPQRLEKAHGYTPQVVQMRRNQTEIRVQEVLAAMEAIHRWNVEDVHADVSGTVRLSVKGRLDLKLTTLMGHSWGAATALTVAHRYPELVHTVIAHEPAIDWSHPKAVASLFAQSRIANLTMASLYRKDLFGNPSPDDDSVHSSANIFFLFSHEWLRKGWAMIPLLLEMQEAKRLGGENTFMHVDSVEDAHHNEFSDTAMLTPVWLGRAIGLTGRRSPLLTAKDVAQKTQTFLQRIRSKV